MHAWWLVGMAATAAVAATAPLPVGHPPEPSAVAYLGRAVLACWGIALLAVGRRRPRLVVGSLALLVGVAVGMTALARIAYPLALLAALAVLACGLVVHAVTPRLAVGLAACWPFAAVYLAHVFMGGGISRSTAVVIALMTIGTALGVMFPQPMTGVVGVALGTVLLAFAWPGAVGFWPLLVLFLAGCFWQLLLPRVVRPPLLGSRPEPDRARVRAALVAARRGALAVIAGGVLAVLLAPLASSGDPTHATRLEALRTATSGRPALLLSPGSSFYLCGTAHPVALASPRGGLAGRLAVLLYGRSCSRELARMRAVKSPEELATMRRAAEITASAFRAVAPLIRPGASERDLERAILAAFEAGGATGVAFKSIVGSGANAVLPHYQRNNAPLRDGLVVIDIGCSVDGYASDITRTFPVAGTWTAEQRRLLDVVLAAKEEARAALVPGASLRALNRQAHATIDAAGFGPYFTHGLGHHVGVDVHDAPADLLAEGMVVTIEPGIYIPSGSDLDRRYWNLGVRVEDTCLVTPSGGVPLADLPEVLHAGEAALAGS